MNDQEINRMARAMSAQHYMYSFPRRRFNRSAFLIALAGVAAFVVILIVAGR